MLHVAIIGGGTVGGGVVEMLAKYYPSIQIEYLIVGNLDRKRDFQIPKNTKISDNWNIIKSDTHVNLVVELMGGTDIAWDIIQYSLSNGISVVTANKALISKRITEIEKLCQENKCNFMYEAAVCGGIPIINTLLRSMHGDELSSIGGVMNGSTNWMLDQMTKDSALSYNTLLVQAKNLGYLEADPSADILGWDARSKLCILIRIAFGVAVKEDDLVCRGIHTVSQEDISFAKSQGKTIKLLARAWKTTNTVQAFVAPALVDANTALGNLPGAGNCVEFNAKFSGHNVIIGSGAGRYPTANSVVADILAARSCAVQLPFGLSDASVQFASDFTAKFFIRTPVELEGTSRVSESVCVTDTAISHSQLTALLTQCDSSTSVLIGL